MSAVVVVVNEDRTVNGGWLKLAKVVLGSDVTAFKDNPECIVGRGTLIGQGQSRVASDLTQIFLTINEVGGLSLFDVVFTRSEVREPVVSIGVGEC